MLSNELNLIKSLFLDKSFLIIRAFAARRRVFFFLLSYPRRNRGLIMFNSYSFPQVQERPCAPRGLPITEALVWRVHHSLVGAQLQDHFPRQPGSKPAATAASALASHHQLRTLVDQQTQLEPGQYHKELKSSVMGWVLNSPIICRNGKKIDVRHKVQI